MKGKRCRLNKPLSAVGHCTILGFQMAFYHFLVQEKDYKNQHCAMVVWVRECANFCLKCIKICNVYPHFVENPKYITKKEKKSDDSESGFSSSCHYLVMLWHTFKQSWKYFQNDKNANKLFNVNLMWHCIIFKFKL